MNIHEYTGNVHMHTPYSDGTKLHAEIAEDAARAGLDFVFVTDHNLWIDGVEGYYDFDGKKVLLLVGEEIHDVRRVPQANHLLVFGAEQEMSPYAADPQQLIDAVCAAGGFTYIAHPFDPPAPQFGESGLSWQDWHVDRYHGLEIWNYMSAFKGYLGGRIRSLRVALNPERYLTSPNPLSLAKWDALLNSGRRISALGGSDAHGFLYRMGPLKRILFPYQFLFGAINMHIVLTAPLTYDLEVDKGKVLRAIGHGRSWIGYDMPLSTQGFRLTATGEQDGSIGDSFCADSAVIVQIATPARCRIRVVHNGQTFLEQKRATNLTFSPRQPGSYRVECYLDYLGRERGWIFTNPVYLS